MTAAELTAKPLMIRCPDKRCGKTFENDKGFWWGADCYGDPTVENYTCPHCWASTRPWDKRRKEFSYDDFKEVE